MSLKDKVAVVIGGGTGIGLGIAVALADAGCQVAISGRREEKLKQAAEGHEAMKYFAADAANRESVRSLFDWVAQEMGAVDILVNSAGINIPNRTMEAMNPEQWDAVMSVNATGVYNTMHAVLPAMRERGDGLIINVASIAGRRAAALGGVAYCASKFAAAALSTAVANEVRETGVRVTTIHPGEVNTPLLDQRPEPVSQERRDKMAQPEDVGALAVAIALLPPRAHVPEIIIKPTVQEYM